MPREITPGELAGRRDPVILVDVREPWEREIVSIPGDLHIPMEEIPARAAEIPRDGRPIVVY